MNCFRQPGTNAATAIVLLAALAIPNRAGAQVTQRARAQPYSDRESAESDDNTQISPATAGVQGPRRRPFVNALVVFPLATRVAATATHPADVLYPSDRFAMAEIVGGGYVLNPRFRFGAVGIFNQVLTGVPDTASTWQFGGVAPIAIGTFNNVIIGGGPVFGYRSGGQSQSDVGAVVLTGASIRLRQGLALNLMAPVTALFTHRSTVSVGVAAGIARVF